MRARIHTPTYRLDFEGSPSLWNDFVRPMVGGPAATPDPVPESAPAATVAGGPAPASFVAPAAPAAAPVVRTVAPPPPPAVPSGVRTYFPPREPREASPEYMDRPGRGPRGDRGRPSRDDAGDARPPWRRRGGPEPEARVEASADADTLYSRLATLDSRRAEKDAVIAAVWFVGRGEREVHEKEVEAHFAAHGGPPDVKVRPLFLKHISRSKLLEAGTQTGLVRLSAKGREHVRLLCGV